MDKSFIEKLEHQLDEIIVIIDKILDNSSIYHSNPNRPNSGVYIVTVTNFYWRDKDEKNQIIALEKYSKFYQNFELFFDKMNPKTLRDINKSNKSILNLIHQNRAPNSIEEGRSRIRKQVNVYKSFLNLLKVSEQRTIILPDTNSIIQYPEPKSYVRISKSPEFNFVILPTVLSELDKHKLLHRNEDFRKKVKSIIKRLKGYRKQGDILKGVIVDKTITVKMVATEPDFSKTLDWIDPENNDDRIIANVLSFQVSHPNDHVVLITSDINLQNKAQLANLSVYDTDDIN